MVMLVYMRALSQHTHTHRENFSCQNHNIIKTRGCGTEPNVRNRGPHGHLHCAITADSRRDNRCIQPSSYTQVCRHGHISKDWCARLVVRSFLTRGWRKSNFCSFLHQHILIWEQKNKKASLWLFLKQKNCIFVHRLVAGWTECVCRHHVGGRLGEDWSITGEKQKFAFISFALLDLKHISGATPRVFN